MKLEIIAAFALAFLSAGVAQADIVDVTLDRSTITAVPGQTVNFTGVITNLVNATVDLNGLSLNVSGALVADGSPFFANAPFFLAANSSSGDFVIFDVAVPAPYTGSSGPQAGIVEILGGVEGSGGYDPTAANILGQADFTVNVAPEPDMAPVYLVCLGALVGAWAWKRWRNAQCAQVLTIVLCAAGGKAMAQTINVSVSAVQFFPPPAVFQSQEILLPTFTQSNGCYNLLTQSNVPCTAIFVTEPNSGPAPWIQWPTFQFQSSSGLISMPGWGVNVSIPTYAFTVNATSLTAGTYVHSVQVTWGSGSQIIPLQGPTLTLTVTLTVTEPTIFAITNAASFSGGAIAPGESVSIFGNAMATSAVACASSGGVYSASCNGVSVLVNGAAMPLMFVSPSQINAQLPFTLSGSSATVQVLEAFDGVTATSATSAVGVSPFAPGLFTANQSGTGIGFFFQAGSGAPITAANPAHPGDLITTYGAGFGITSPVIAAGVIPGASPFYLPLTQAALTVEGLPASIGFEGLAPCCAGYYQFNFTVPNGATPGNGGVVATVGGLSSNSVILPLAQASQTIAFNALSSVTYGVQPFNVSATATSGLPVTFTSTTGSVCTVLGNTVTIASGGMCSIAANQAGNASFGAAPTVIQSFTVNKASQTITFNALNGVTYGVQPFSVNAAATSGLAVTFTSTTTGVCTVAGSTVTVLAGGSCTIQANQAGNVDYQAAPLFNRSFTVNKASQTIAFPPLNAVLYGVQPFNVSATATSGLAVAFTSITSSVCTASGNTVTIVSAGMCTIQANQSGDGNYQAAPLFNRSFTVNKASQTVTFGPLSNVTYGVAPFNMSASTSSGLPVTFTSTTTTVCTVSGNTVTIVSGGTCSIQALQAGNVDYHGQGIIQSFTVNLATPIVTWAAPAAITFGSALGTPQLNATASVPGTFVYTPPAGTVLPAGNGQALSVTFTPTASNDYNSVTTANVISVTPPPPPTGSQGGSGTPNLTLTTKLSRNAQNAVVATVSVANNGTGAAQNVVLTVASIGAAAGSPLPQPLGSIAAGSVGQITVTFPASVGISGAGSSLTLSGAYTGGTFQSAMRIVLP